MSNKLGGNIWLYFFYIVSISFQVSGALLLVSISTKRENIIKDFTLTGLTNKNKNGNAKKINYNHNALKEKFRNAYLNKISFIFIALGYLLGIWGSIIEEKRLIAAISILVTTTIIMLLTRFIIDKKVKKSKQVDKKITDEELNLLGIDVDLENISNEEIDKIFDN